MSNLMKSIATRILIHLNRNPKKDYLFKIYKEIDCTVTSCHVSIQKLLEIKLLEVFEFDKLIKHIKLTKKGKKIAERLDKIDVILG